MSEGIPTLTYGSDEVQRQRIPTGILVLWSATIFLSAFLLFQIQPMLAKMILPWFGGAAGVWATSLMFFQVTYLLGSYYAHVLVQRTRPAQQMWTHVLLLAASLFLLPVIPQRFLEAHRRRPSGVADSRPADRHCGSAFPAALGDQPAAASVVCPAANRRPAVPVLRALERRVALGAALVSYRFRAAPFHPTSGGGMVGGLPRIRVAVRGDRVSPASRIGSAGVSA